MNTFKFRPIGTSLVEKKQRSELLTITLRAEYKREYDITSEYPLVLGEEASSTSFGLFSKADILVSHANLLFRNLTQDGESTTTNIALVGNVATHPDYQGKGLMTQLFQELDFYAAQNNARAILLWSDLNSFYQKIGFLSVGQERRFLLERSKMSHIAPLALVQLNPQTVSLKTLEDLLTLRPRTGWGIERSPEEFKTLLSIPECRLYSTPNLSSYFIVGKGCDMQNVIHEWGMSELSELSGGIRALFDQFPESDQLCLLAPSDLTPAVFKATRNLSSKMEKHPMAWLKRLDAIDSIQVDFNQLFVWGLDSI